MRMAFMEDIADDISEHSGSLELSVFMRQRIFRAEKVAHC
jgi:hypothetical protein